MKIIKNKIGLKQFDNFLLIHAPTLWATKIHYLIVYAIVYSAIFTMGANLMPITYNRAANPIIVMTFLSFAIVMFYGWWILNQRLLGYMKLYGVTGNFFLLKTLLTAYLSLIVAFAVFVPPCLTYFNRLEGQFIDKHLPPLNLKNFQSQIWSSKFYFDHPEYDIYENRKKTIDALTDFSSATVDSAHSFRLSSSKMLSNQDLIKHYLFNSGIGVDSIVSNSTSHLIHVYFVSKAWPIFSQTINVIRTDIYKDENIKSELYNTTIIARTYTALSNDLKTKTPLKIYFYKSPNSQYYRYCDESTIQGSLLLDKMISFIGKAPNDVKLEKLYTMIDIIKPLEGLNYLPFIIALTACLFFIMLVYIISIFDSGHAFTICSTYLFITMTIAFFFPNIGPILTKYLVIPSIITLMSIILVWKLSKLHSRSNLTVLIALIAMSIPGCLVIIMTLTSTGTFFESSFSINNTLVSKVYNNFKTTYCLAFLFLIILPWFFATRIHRLSVLPLK